MGVRILHDRDNDAAVLYCSTGDWAFGPVFSATDDATASEQAAGFVTWLRETTGKDPRTLSDAELERVYATWRQETNA